MESLDAKFTGHVTIGREFWDVPIRVQLRPYWNSTAALTYR